MLIAGFFICRVFVDWFKDSIEFEFDGAVFYL